MQRTMSAIGRPTLASDPHAEQVQMGTAFGRHRTLDPRMRGDARLQGGHGRRPRPGTRTIEKYGASSSRLSTSGMTTSAAMVPRST